MEKVIKAERKPLFTAVDKVLKCVKPKDKDSVVRQMVLIIPGGNTLSVFGTNESLTVFCKDIPCSDGGANMVAVDLAKFAKVLDSQADSVSIKIDETAKVTVKSGKSVGAISYLRGKEYLEYVANPEYFPTDVEWVEIASPSALKALLKLMLLCADPKIEQLSGVYVSDGTFASTNTYLSMFADTTEIPEMNFGFEAIVPPEFMTLCSILGDKIFMHYQQGKLWVRNEDYTIVGSCITVSPENFPMTGLLSQSEKAHERMKSSLSIKVEDLKELLGKFNGFFGSSVVCRLRCDGTSPQIWIEGMSENGDKLQDVLYTADGSTPEALNIRCYYNSLEVLAELFQGTFDLCLSADARDPLFAHSEVFHVDYMFSSYYRED